MNDFELKNTDGGQSDNGATPKQEAVISALLSSPTLKDAAEAVGISTPTLYRMMQRPAFQKEYRAARRQLVEHTIGELQGATTEAVATLRRALTCGDARTEVRAAQIIIGLSVKGLELLDMEERLETLESQMEKRKLWG